MKRPICALRILEISPCAQSSSNCLANGPFKKQYGVSPAEYRKQTEKTEAFYGDFFNDTVGARLVHEFKDFKIADTDEVIDFMLETGALKYGYVAICCRVNGGATLYSGEDFRDGFIWFTEWDGRFMGDIVCEDYEKIADYLKTEIHYVTEDRTDKADNGFVDRAHLFPLSAQMRLF